MSQLGLRAGIWFQPDADTPHLEYHPKLPTIREHPRHCQRNCAARGAAVTPGTALARATRRRLSLEAAEQNLYLGSNVENISREMLQVFELKHENGWILLKRWRHIARTPSAGRANGSPTTLRRECFDLYPAATAVREPALMTWTSSGAARPSCHRQLLRSKDRRRQDGPRPR